MLSVAVWNIHADDGEGTEWRLTQVGDYLYHLLWHKLQYVSQIVYGFRMIVIKTATISVAIINQMGFLGSQCFVFGRKLCFSKWTLTINSILLPCTTGWDQISTWPNGTCNQFSIKSSWSGSQIRRFEETSVSDWCRIHRQGPETNQYQTLPHSIPAQDRRS